MSLSADFWDAKYKKHSIGWDIGEISAPLKTYIDQLKNKNIHILIPGGGNAYEAEYLHHLGYKNVYVIDLSEQALNNIKQRVPSFPNTHLIQGDFFSFHLTCPNTTFDLILEQTFFCAIHPSQRESYSKQIHKLLKNNGKLVGVLFNDTLNTDKPPFGGSEKEYLNYFKKGFKILTMKKCYNSILERKDRELFIRILKD